MTKYEVSVVAFTKVYQNVEVDASNEKEAYEKAIELASIYCGDYEVYDESEIDVLYTEIIDEWDED